MDSFGKEKVVDERLAVIALAESHGGGQMPFKDPFCTSVANIRNKLVLQFDQPRCTNGDKPAQGFEIG